MAVARLETCEDVGELARELGVRPRCLYKWRRKLEMVQHTRIGSPQGNPSLEAAFGREDLGDFFKRALQKVEARRQKRGGTGETASTSSLGAAWLDVGHSECLGSNAAHGTIVAVSE